MKNYISNFVMATAIFTSGLMGPLSVSAAGPATLDLGTAGNFVIFANTAVANPNANSIITGDIGAGPGITSTAITGFAPILPMDGAFSTSLQVTGNIYAFDYAVPTPTAVNTASNDMLTAYNDAAGRSSPTATELGAGDISGMTLAPGLYKWSTGVLINTDVTLSGSASDVWIFQIAGDLSIASGGSVPSGVKVILSGGAQASNIFWQVGGGTGVTLGTYSTFNGSILSATQVVMQTGAVLNGRALAQTQVTLDANTVSVPVLVVPPTTGPVFIDTNVNGVLDSGESFFNTIQAAITASVSNDTIHVTAGTYTEVGQIVINKNLSIVGDDKATTIIKPNQDTGSTADDKGWFLVNSGMTFNLSNVTLDGVGFKIYHAIKYNGSGVVNNVKFINIKYEESGPAYNGAGVRIAGTGNVDVTNSQFSEMGRYGVQIYWDSSPTGTFSGNTYTGKGVGNWLDYAFEIGGGAHVTITNNTISGNRGVATDGSDSSAISVWDDPDTEAIINSNTLTDNHIGIAIAVINGGTPSPVTTVGTGNTFTGNDIGIDVQSVGAFGSPTVTVASSTFSGNTIDAQVIAGMTANNISFHNNIFSGLTANFTNSGIGTIDATSNWWGNASGPMNLATNPSGTGGVVSDGVSFSPWYTNVERTTLNTDVVVVPPTPVTPPPTSRSGGNSRNRATPATPAVPGISSAIPATPAIGLGRVLGASSYRFSGTLSQNASSNAVTELQNRLKAEGFFSATPTGYFGPITFASVRAYQVSKGLPSTGFVGPLTMEKLNADSNEAEVPVQGISVKNFINLLIATGVISGDKIEAARIWAAASN